ncbi:hypothetical protein AYM40_10600 [Paraburkholderia phytofirmans OLGA172]|uniref:Uncharacterized protein n=1 Tax=Paraburkholderia phytofirmans OLGA172 TaxID=1417228 RepID=A0A160FK76_9BURK|nr:hypothetical protein [Paraburkholderia phytofirmans]ANB72761.1 hypothetical protein AYM40_10600 [Paraburkholderia phytofirmans OLGA172]
MPRVVQRAVFIATFCILVQIAIRRENEVFRASEFDGSHVWIGGLVPLAYLPALDGTAMTGRFSEGIVFYIDPGVDVWPANDV